MTQTKHTPGPWIAHSYVGAWCVIHSANGVFKNIALVPGGEADARLIAAAPDLLEALLVARGYTGYAQAEPDDMALIDAALSKALGHDG